MQLLATFGIVSGESGAASLAGARSAWSESETRAILALSTDSRVMAFGTEGATDETVYAALTETEGS
jgi:diaminopropionate ammonia-lyase